MFNRYHNVWPLSMLALKATASHLAIPRQPSVSHTSSTNVNSHCDHCQFLDLETANQVQDLKLFSRYIKPKKYHEISVMAKVKYLY